LIFVRCCGGDFATTSTARSKRVHASGCKSGSEGALEGAINKELGIFGDPTLPHWVNQTRSLMAYDRKLKNAVSKSVMELMAREGIRLRWEMKIEGEAHDLAATELSSCCAEHLGGKQLTLGDDGSKSEKVPLEERLHSDGCVEMLAAAFGGTSRSTPSIVDNLSKIDWVASVKKKGPPRDSVQTDPKRPSSGKKKMATWQVKHEFKSLCQIGAGITLKGGLAAYDSRSVRGLGVIVT
jgi:hypothetical protein